MMDERTYQDFLNWGQSLIPDSDSFAVTWRGIGGVQTWVARLPSRASWATDRHIGGAPLGGEDGREGEEARS